MECYKKGYVLGDEAQNIRKRCFTEKVAIRIAQAYNIKPETIHKYNAYKCKNCHNWHVGKGSIILSDEDKEKIKQKIKSGLYL